DASKIFKVQINSATRAELINRTCSGSWSEWSPCSVTCGSGSQRREFRCSVCQNAWIQKTRGCFTSCINHSITNQGMLRRGKNNMALNNNSIREALVSSEIQCAHYCLRSPECRSINV
ncbi:unnamed protein product, partial [Porites lobata]